MPEQHDIDVIRGLAAEVAEITRLPVHEEKKKLWRQLNAIRGQRPMVMIEQVCWNEMNVDDELTLRCHDDECRGYEMRLRKIIYQWNHFPVDMVVEPAINVGKAISGLGLGLSAKDQVAVGDPTNAVRGHKYKNQLQTEADIEKI